MAQESSELCEGAVTAFRVSPLKARIHRRFVEA
jgi:hypothetical protein